MLERRPHNFYTNYRETRFLPMHQSHVHHRANVTNIFVNNCGCCCSTPIWGCGCGGYGFGFSMGNGCFSMNCGPFSFGFGNGGCYMGLGGFQMSLGLGGGGLGFGNCSWGNPGAYFPVPVPTLLAPTSTVSTGTGNNNNTTTIKPHLYYADKKEDSSKPLEDNDSKNENSQEKVEYTPQTKNINYNGDNITVTQLPTGAEATKANFQTLAGKNILVRCAQNSDSRDQYIVGKISNVEENDGIISYKIDCTDSNGNYKLKYKVMQKSSKNTTWKIEYESGTSGTSGTPLYYKDGGVEYVESTGEGLLQRTGDPLISTNKIDDTYKELQPSQ